MPGHTHDYYSKSKEINAQVWDLFSHTRLETDPKYRVYADPLSDAPDLSFLWTERPVAPRRGEGLSFSDTGKPENRGIHAHEKRRGPRPGVPLAAGATAGGNLLPGRLRDRHVGPGRRRHGGRDLGNQFVAGATVTVGGAAASASVTSSTRIGATMPARGAGSLYDIVVDNPGRRRHPAGRAGSPTSSTCRRRAPSTRPSRRWSATGSRRAAAGATSARAPRSRAPRWPCSSCAPGTASATCRRPRPAAIFADVARVRLRRRLDRGALRRGHHGRLRHRPPALLPEQPDHARPDGGLPPEGLPRHHLCAAAGAGRLQRRRHHAAARALDRGARAPVGHGRLRRHVVLPRPTPSRAARWPSS